MAILPSYLLLTLASLLQNNLWQFETKIDLQQPLTAAHVSAIGKVYYGTQRGQLYSFFADGAASDYFSSKSFQPITYLDASNPLRIFIFFSDIGAFEILERFSALPRTYYFYEFNMKNPQLVSYDKTNTLWILLDNKMIKLDPFDRMIKEEKTWLENENYENIIQMEAHDELFFLDSEKGIFNENGILPCFSRQDISFFQVMGPKLMALTPGSLIFWNQYSNTCETVPTPIENATLAIQSNGYFHFVKGSQIFIYKLRQ